MSRLLSHFNRILRELQNDRVGAYAAQTAFFLFLSVIPFFIFLVTLIKFTPLTGDLVIKYVEDYLPEYIAPVLVPIIEEIFDSALSVMTVSIIGAIWASAKGIHSMSNGLNAIYGLPEKRNFFVLRFRAILNTLIFTVLIIAGIVSAMYGRRVKKLILENVTIKFRVFKTVIDFRYIIFAAVLFILFVIILMFLPNRTRKFKYVLIPAFLASICWTLLSWAISVYVNYFDGFSMYGSMMAIMLAIMWIYFGMYILFIAAELDSMYSEALFLELKKRKIEKIRKKRR